MTGDGIGLILRTAGRLPRAQLAWWVLRRLQERVPMPAPLSRRAPAGPGRAGMAQALRRDGPGDARSRLARASEVTDGRFTLLGESRSLGTPDWRRRYGGRLWNFTLQYQGYLVDLAWAAQLEPQPAWIARIEELVGAWLRDVGRGGGDAWSPYVLARRTANWIRTLLLVGDALEAGLRDRMTRSLHAQLRRLDRRLEYHLRGNHLLADLHALALGGLFFDGSAALRWRRERLPEFWAEFLAQVMPDGVHEERSPMYHAIVLGDALEVATHARATGFSLAAEVEERLGRMIVALRLLSRPDGAFHLFNDSAHGQSQARNELLDRAAHVLALPAVEPGGEWSLPDAGYWGVIRPDGTRLIVDAGRPGPNRQPGHAHCDMLSFELDIKGAQVIVDSGVAGYGGHPLREYVRSTRAHNTLAVDGREQSEVWGTFRLARQAEVLGVHRSGSTDDWRFGAACRHYHNAGIVHHREFRLVGQRLVIADRIEGAVGRLVNSWFHLHPALGARLEGGRWIVEGAGVRVRLSFEGAGAASLVAGVRTAPAQGWYCPAFGLSVPATVFELALPAYDGRPITAVLDWSAE